MSRYFLTAVQIEGFRGINNENQPLRLSFKTDRVNSVFAPNATGKSSIFEALCFAIRGYVPKLRTLQVGERPEDYVGNLFHSAKTAVVRLELQDETGTACSVEVKRGPDGQRSVVSPSGLTDPEGVLKSLDEDFTLLDYGQFTNFIDRTPLERGRTFAALLGLSGYSQLRQTLQGLSDVRNLNSDFDLPALRTAASTCETESQEALARFGKAYTSLTGKALADTSDVVHWAADVKAALVSIELFRPVIENQRLSEIDFDHLRVIVRNHEGGTKRDELKSLIEANTRLESFDLTPADSAIQRAGDLKEAVAKRARLLAATPGSDYQKLHEVALSLYRSSEWHDDKQCALCKSQLSAPLLPTIETEVAQFEEIRGLDREIRAMVGSAKWIQCLSRLEAIPELTIPQPDRLAGLLMEGAYRASLREATIDDAVDRLSVLVGRLRTKIDEVSARRVALERELPPSLVAVTTQLEYASVARESLATYWRQTSQLTKVRAQLGRYERWAKYIAAVTEEICQAEAMYTVDRLKALDSSYKDLFRKVMGVGDVVPTLERSALGEHLDVQLEDFHGLHGVSARALLSESFRNALAISVFLSAAAQQTTAARFVVLDDITSSFDAGHQWRLMDEIRTRLQYKTGSDGLQFILLSHDGLLEKYFDKVAAGGDWHHQRLQGWPPLGAISTVGQDAGRIRKTATDFLLAGQVKEAEPLIRQYLEYSLLSLIRKVNIPVPFDFSIRDQLQMVGNSLDVIMAAVKLQDSAGGLILTPTQVADLEIRHVPALVGNWVSHYSTAVSANVTPPVLLGVLQSVDDLAACFKYEDTTASPPAIRWYRSLTSK